MVSRIYIRKHKRRLSDGLTLGAQKFVVLFALVGFGCQLKGRGKYERLPVSTINNNDKETGPEFVLRRVRR
jgi:hypothetical protein